MIIEASDHYRPQSPFVNPDLSPWAKVLSPRADIIFAMAENHSEQEAASLFENELNATISEFVLRDRLTRVKDVTYGGGRLSWGGIDLGQSCHRVAVENGILSREWAEWEGLERINNLLQGVGPEATVMSISPPKVADYGFLFFYQKTDSGEIKQTLVRYDEKMGEQTKTRELMARLGLNIDGMETNDFVRSAALISSKADSLIATALSEVSSPTELRSQSLDKMAIINDPDIVIWKAEYLSLMSEMLRGGIDETAIKRLQLLRDAICEKAQLIITSSRSQQKNHLQVSKRLIFDDKLPKEVHLLRMAALARFTSLSASDCAIISNNERGSYLEMNVVMNFDDVIRGGFNLFDMMHGIPRPESATHYPDYRCEGADKKNGCGKWISGEPKGDESKWRTECPHCSLSFACKKTTTDEVFSIEGEIGNA